MLGRRRGVVTGRVLCRHLKETIHRDGTAFENGFHNIFLFIFDMGHNRHEMIHTHIPLGVILQGMMDLTEVGHEDHFMQYKMGGVFGPRREFFMTLLIH